MKILLFFFVPYIFAGASYGEDSNGLQRNLLDERCNKIIQALFDCENANKAACTGDVPVFGLCIEDFGKYPLERSNINNDHLFKF